METGKISYYSNMRGFGFITPDDTPDDDETQKIFFHITDLVNFKQYQDDLQEGNRVKYEVDENEKGLFAKCIVVEIEE